MRLVHLSDTHIDGVQHERRTRKTKRRGVPLPRKVGWVRENKSRFDIEAGTGVEGLLVVNTASPVQEYKECRVEFINDFEPGCV